MTDGTVQIQPMACFLNVPFNHDNLLLTMASHPFERGSFGCPFKMARGGAVNPCMPSTP